MNARCPDCGLPVENFFDHITGCTPEEEAALERRDREREAESNPLTSTGCYLDRFASVRDLQRRLIRQTWRQWLRGLAWGNLIDSFFFFPIPGWRIETDAELRFRLIAKMQEEMRIAEQTYRALVGGKI